MEEYEIGDGGYLWHNTWIGSLSIEHIAIQLVLIYFKQGPTPRYPFYYVFMLKVYILLGHTYLHTLSLLCTSDVSSLKQNSFKISLIDRLTVSSNAMGPDRQNWI